MARPAVAFLCNVCAAETLKWQGQCPQCGEWNSLEQRLMPRAGTAARPAVTTGKGANIAPSRLEVAGTDARFSTGLAELDRVLGGGVVPGSVSLIGGDPGIGKSTLLLQMLGAVGERLSGLYVTGEESLAQVAARAQRLGLPLAPLRALAETCVERIIEHAAAQKPRVLIVDSIQTIWTELLTAAPGSVSQVRESAAKLTRFAKETGVSVFLVGHVTKEGGIAGPRVLEHMVDAVLYFEGESGSRFRVLRAFKNRFGAVNELGVFAMSEKGLREVPNPSAIFLSAHSGPTPGSAVMVTREGTRPLLVEVQALVDQSPLANPRRVALGLEQNRLAMLLAVLHRHGGAAVYDQDVFVNVVGGIRVQETAADLPILLAILSSFRDRALPDKLVAFGEVGLSGEIRPVPNGEERLKEAATHGFLKAVVPKANAPKKSRIGDMEIVGAERLSEALGAIL
ncbi:MAG: DNA repair protein RadA [Rhodanobacteraceae bacterium]